jgi:hypothetical protein
VGDALRACRIVLVLGVVLPALARAQAGMEMAPAIPIHPDVPTILELPDQVERVWFIDDGNLMVQGARNKVYVRPRPGAPVGLEAYIEVKTRTLHRVFLVRVVERAGDATRAIVVPPAGAVQREDENDRAAASTAPTSPAPPVNTPAPAPAPLPAEIEPAVPAVAADAVRAEPTAERDTVASMANPSAGMIRRSRFDLALHAVGGLGFTGAKVEGYEPRTALRPHYSLGLRLTGEPRNSWWSVDADISGESPAGRMLYDSGSGSKLAIRGPRLRLEMGTRAGIGTTWRASGYASIGLQVHLRQAEEEYDVTKRSETMERSAVLGLGVGLQYRGYRRSLLSLDFLVRQGGLDDYTSISVLLTLGRFLEQGD